MLTQPLLVEDLMSPRVVTISMDNTLRDVRQIFNQRRFHHLVVMEKGQPVGVISDRDWLKNISPFIGIPLGEKPRDSATLKKRVHQIMTRKLVSISPESPANEAANLMIERNVSCLPVVNKEGKLLGIITTRDLLRWIVRKEDLSNQT